jgi:hypothetical protein
MDIQEKIKEFELILDDNELQHMKQDEIYRSFIKAVSKGMSKEESQELATLIKNKIIKKDKGRWYA